MPYIIVDEQQTSIILSARGSVEIRDPKGNCLGYVAHGFTDADLAVAKQRLASNEPRFTTQQVLDHLRSLEAK